MSQEPGAAPPVTQQTPRPTPRVGIVFRPQLPPERLRGFVAAAEAAGLDELWLWEDCFLEGGLTSATAALAWSSSMRVGLGLMPVPLRNPALAAMETATLARLFPGRFVPAVGHGVQPWMAQVGAAAASPMGLLREWLPAFRALLDGATVTTAGRYVRLDGVTLDWPPAAPVPVLAGARGPRTLALAGELADGVVLDAGHTPASARAAIAVARTAVAGTAVAGTAARPPREVAAYVPCGAGPEAAGRLAAGLRPSGAPPAERVAAGTPEQAAAQIRAFAEAGVTSVVLQPAGDDPDVEATIRFAGAARAAALGGN